MGELLNLGTNKAVKSLDTLGWHLGADLVRCKADIGDDVDLVVQVLVAEILDLGEDPFVRTAFSFSVLLVHKLFDNQARDVQRSVLTLFHNPFDPWGEVGPVVLDRLRGLPAQRFLDKEQSVLWYSKNHRLREATGNQQYAACWG